MKTCTAESLTEVIARLGGSLKSGSHRVEEGECCVLEARSVCLGVPWTDNPDAVGMPDIRPLNDGPWSSDAVRTEAMIRLAAAYDGWAMWTTERQQAIMTTVVIRTVNQIVSELPDLTETIREQCRNASTLPDAARAAEAARAARAAWTAWAAWAARKMWAARDKVLLLAVDIWIQAVTQL